MKGWQGDSDEIYAPIDPEMAKFITFLRSRKEITTFHCCSGLHEESISAYVALAVRGFLAIRRFIEVVDAVHVQMPTYNLRLQVKYSPIGGGCDFDAEPEAVSFSIHLYEPTPTRLKRLIRAFTNELAGWPAEGDTP